MSGFDPRITPARPDLAAAHLRGKVTAARFVEGVVREVFDAQAPLRIEPYPDASLSTEALKGERITVYDENGEGWCWGQLASDGYVGWLPANALVAPGPEATHKVAALRTFAFLAPSIKAPPMEGLSLGCRLAIARAHNEFAVTASGAYLPARHLAKIDAAEPDFVAVAERFVGVPYLWGGKTSLGLDCSGLIQVALTAAGIACPRDSDMQEQALGAALPFAGDSSQLRRGDLVFWKGHVAIARDAATLVHANAFHMAVAIEPLEEALRRIEASGSRVTSVKRLPLAR
jgi:cell wall-associated NlpC family hydrolase